MVAGLLGLIESERDRWILWLPVALAAGIAVYFAWPDEPPLFAAAVAPLFALGLLLLWRGRPGWPVWVGLLMLSLGFFAGAWRSHAVAAPILPHAVGPIRLQGRVIAVEPVEHGVRVLLDQLTGAPLDQLRLDRVRIKLRGDYGLHPGQRVQLRANLSPPAQPLLPAGYDFARAAWFQRIGAVGYASGRPLIVKQVAPSWSERAGLALARERQRLAARIVGAITAAQYPPGIAAVASALVTGQRGPVPPETLAAYRDAGLAHILVIAGMHLSMVAGLVLVGLRAGLALWPWAALRLPLHKLAAAGALLVTLAYLLISGAPVPTQRAFIMSCCLLLAVLLDRQAMSLRAISLAAMLILLTQPEALLSPSFQLSFAAVYGLIAGYEALTPALARWRGEARAIWQKGAVYLGGILLTTQIAGSATAFYSLFHFSRYAVYSLLGNAVAVPLVGFWVMPSALLAAIALPFGLDGWFWRLMAAGLEQVTAVARFVSGLSGATFDCAALPTLCLPIFSLGLAWLILWRRRWRLFGLAPMALAVVMAALAPKPDLLLDGGLKLAAIREADGRLHVNLGPAPRSLRQAWAKFDGEEGALPLWSGGTGLDCDPTGCSVHGDHGDWRVPLERSGMAARGTLLVWRRGEGVARMVSVADWQGRRPWRPT